MKDRKNKYQKQTGSTSPKSPIKPYPINPPSIAILKPDPIFYNGKEIKEEEILLCES